MKVFVTSDTHGYLPEITEEFDLFLICGDVCPAHDHYFSYQKEWFETVFVEWVKQLPFKGPWAQVVMTWGNHDMLGERLTKPQLEELRLKSDGKLVILKNEAYDFQYLDGDDVKTVKIFGTPYCKIFGSWAFMVSPEKLHEKYSKIPEGLDILISHDSPHINNLGLIQDGWNAGEDAGNFILDEYIREKAPRYFFSGHIHSGNHNFELVNVAANPDEEEKIVKMANVSYINERYWPSYGVLSFDYD